MGKMSASTAAFRICGDDLDPDEIAPLLGAEPTHAHRKGDQTSPKMPGLARRSGLWLIETGWEDGNQLEAQIRGILSRLTDDLAVWRAIGKRFEMDMFCGIEVVETNPGLDLEAPVLSMLADRSIAFRVCIYLDHERIRAYLAQWAGSDDYRPVARQ